MMYAPGVQEDALMHSKFHLKMEKIVNFTVFYFTLNKLHGIFTVLSSNGETVQ